MMKKEYRVWTEGQIHKVVVSDEREVLLAAEAAGKASVGLWRKDRELGGIPYVVESEEGLTDSYLKQVVRRKLGLPWIIAKTKRLLIREFQAGDESQVPEEPQDGWEDRIFSCPDRLRDYIRCQYGFFQYGIWAVTEKKSGRIIGKAGVTNLQWDGCREPGLELGYHIFTPYRGQGYAGEACRAVLEWCKKEQGCPVYAKIDASNEASVKVAKKLGFRLIDRRYIGSGRWHCLYVWNCPAE